VDLLRKIAFAHRRLTKQPAAPCSAVPGLPTAFELRFLTLLRQVERTIRALEANLSKSEQERLAQTVSFRYYSFCPENCTQGNCPCVRLPYLKSQPQSKRLCCGNCAKAVMGIYSRFTFCSYPPPGRTLLKSLISSSARARSVYRSVKAYRAARLDWRRDDQSSPGLSRWQKTLRSLIKLSPRVLGWCRVRWSCAALSMTLAVLAQIKVSRETIRLELKAAGYVWKRAKLKGRDDDPERARRLARIRLLFENQRPDELILFAD
jgi:hypothetical protein